jgi:hypothetical protein
MLCFAWWRERKAELRGVPEKAIFTGDKMQSKDD